MMIREVRNIAKANYDSRVVDISGAACVTVIGQDPEILNAVDGIPERRIARYCAADNLGGVVDAVGTGQREILQATVAAPKEALQIGTKAAEANHLAVIVEVFGPAQIGAIGEITDIADSVHRIGCPWHRNEGYQNSDDSCNRAHGVDSLHRNFPGFRMWPSGITIRAGVRANPDEMVMVV